MWVRVREARVHLGQLLPLDRRLGSERDVLGDGAVEEVLAEDLQGGAARVGE